LFFALWPDDPVRREIHAASRRAVERCGGKPIPPQNFHITLAFLGSVTAEWVEPVVATATVAAGSVHVEAFVLELDRLGHWPGSQVVWFGCSQLPDAVHALARDLRQSLRAHALKPDGQRFVPHLTLARWVQQAGSFEAPAAIRWPVDEFVLVRSVSRPGGVDYSLLGRWPLAATHGPPANNGF
jgi:2'-5' RNA ligase